MEALKDFDYAKILIWVVPGAFIALFRSFALRGSFPTIAKDDISALILGSVIFWFLLGTVVPQESLASLAAQARYAGAYWVCVLVLVPTLVGFGLGLFEASDWTGRGLRHLGIQMPSPTPTAWDTLFRGLAPDSVLLLTLKDGTTVFGRWTGGAPASAASTDPDKMDLFIGEIGIIDADGDYVPNIPRRGAYVASGEIRTIEIV